MKATHKLHEKSEFIDENVKISGPTQRVVDCCYF